jgi:hypothetical protein
MSSHQPPHRGRFIRFNGEECIEAKQLTAVTQLGVTPVRQRPPRCLSKVVLALRTTLRPT